MQQGLKQLTEDQVYRLGMDDAQHQDFNVTGVLILVSFAGVLMAVSLALGVLIGVMI